MTARTVIDADRLRNSLTMKKCSSVCRQNLYLLRTKGIREKVEQSSRNNFDRINLFLYFSGKKKIA